MEKKVKNKELAQKDETHCPVCGSSEIIRIETKEKISVPFAKEFEISVPAHKCNHCNEVGDFTGEFAKALNHAVDVLNKSSMTNILSNLNSKGYTNSYIERVYELPKRTLARWKTGEFSDSGLALMRLTAQYDFLLKVAESSFDQSVAFRELMLASVKLFANAANSTGTALSYMGSFEGSQPGTKVFQIKSEIKAGNENDVVEVATPRPVLGSL